MYGGYDDAGPGPSRRAWSPAYPATTRRSADFDAGYRGGGGGGGGTGGWSRRREREPSDVSVEVEALDLADYGRSMNHGGYDAGVPGALPMRYEHDYPPPRPFSANPFASPPTSPDHTQRLSPSYTGHHSPSPPGRPFSTQTRDSFAPSLVSGPTAPTSHSSHSHDNYYYSQFNYPRRTSAPPPAHANSDPGAAQAYGFGRRGAPPAAHVQHTGIFAPGGPQNRSSGSLPRVNTPKSPDNDIDVRNFPRFSRGWYDNNNGTKSNLRDVGGPPILFPDFNGAPMHTVKPAPYVSPPSYASGSQREFLPWGAAPDEGESVPDIIKEERMRMLEREFGSRPPRAPAEKEEEPEERIVGSVDSRGNLITPGPRKRLWVRITEACFSFGAGVAGIYAAFVRAITNTQAIADTFCRLSNLTLLHRHLAPSRRSCLTCLAYSPSSSSCMFSSSAGAASATSLLRKVAWACLACLAVSWSCLFRKVARRRRTRNQRRGIRKGRAISKSTSSLIPHHLCRSNRSAVHVDVVNTLNSVATWTRRTTRPLRHAAVSSMVSLSSTSGASHGNTRSVSWQST